MSTYHGDDMLGVTPRKKLLLGMSSRIIRHLKKNKIAKRNLYLVGSGLSGVALASALGYIIGCRWGFIRKKSDRDNHGADGREMSKVSDYIIAVDDFVVSGKTIRRIAGEIEIDAVCVDVDFRGQGPYEVYKSIGIDGLCIIMPTGTYIPEGE